MSSAQFNCQTLNKLRFFSAVSSGWKTLLSTRLKKCRQSMPPIILGFADSKLKDLTVPTTSFIGIQNNNLLISISDPASLWCHIIQHLGVNSLPRPFTDLELSLAITQAGTPTSASFPQHVEDHSEIVQPEVTQGDRNLHSFNATLQHWLEVDPVTGQTHLCNLTKSEKRQLSSVLKQIAHTMGFDFSTSSLDWCGCNIQIY